MFWYLKGLEYALSMGARVLVNSWSSGDSFPSDTVATLMQAVFARVESQNVFVINAAGNAAVNDGLDLDDPSQVTPYR